MNMQRKLGPLFLAAMFCAIGCATEAEPSRGGSVGPSGGKEDDADAEEEGMVSAAQEQHLEQVGTCEALANRGRETISALRIPESLEVEETRLACLQAANDATVDELNAALSDASSDLAGSTTDVFRSWRAKHTSFCGLMVEASVDALTKAASVRQTACLAEAELKLAEAIEGFGDLGGVNSKAAEDTETYPECYAAYRDALDAVDASPSDEPAPDSPGAEDDVPPAEDPAAGEDPTAGDDPAAPSGDALIVEATEDLASCIQTETQKLEEDVAARVVDSFPGRAGTGIDGEISKAVAAVVGVSDSVCEVLVQSKGDSEFAVATCEVSTSIWRARLMTYVVPDLGR